MNFQVKINFCHTQCLRNENQIIGNVTVYPSQGCLRFDTAHGEHIAGFSATSPKFVGIENDVICELFAAPMDVPLLFDMRMDMESY